MMVIKTKDGRRLYPVCNWMDNQHKIYNYNDKMATAYYDNPEGDDEYEAMRESERLIEVFDNGVRNDGLVYAEYNDYKKLKDIIGFYDARH